MHLVCFDVSGEIWEGAEENVEQKAVDEFFKLAVENGAKDNGQPGIRAQMSRQPYYAAYVIDPDGNNLEAVCVDNLGVRSREA